MAVIPKEFIDAVLSIGVKNEKAINWIGTGFLIVKELRENTYQPMLISNKHVLLGKDSVVIRLRKKTTGELAVIDMPLQEDGKILFSIHPDSQVDIAAVLLNGSYLENNKLEVFAFNIDTNALTSDEFLNNGGGEGSNVYMLGFPMGLVDIDSNMPICRGGCVARADRQEIKRTKNMLLDIQNFPGNSGSPIITKPEVISLGDTMPLNKAALIGIIHSYIPYRESLINNQTGEVVEIRSENSGIAKANPVEFINEVIEMELKRNYSEEELKEFKINR